MSFEPTTSLAVNYIFFAKLFKFPALQTNGLHCSGSHFAGFLICSVMHHLLKENKPNYCKVDRRIELKNKAKLRHLAWF